MGETTKVNLDPVKIRRCHCEWSLKMQRAARSALRREAKGNPKFLKDNLDADVLIEQVWNAIVEASGHDKRATP